MRRAYRHAAAGTWPQAERQSTITLVWDDRHRRRIRLTDDAGADFLLDLERATHLADGDGLALESGGWIEVRAAVEDVIDVEAREAGALARIAWHIGNRHTPLQFLPGGTLRLVYDHVLADMIAGLGATITRGRASFQPEPGAYDHGRAEPAAQAGHHHDHHHDHSHHHHEHHHNGHHHHDD